jgi:hypothetical protein
MKYFLLSVIIFFPVIIQAKTKPRIAIFDISVNSTVNEQNLTTEDISSKVVRNKIEVSLFSTGKYELLERDSIQLILKERDLIGSNFENTNNAVKAGKYLYADFVIAGSLTYIDNYILNIRIINVSRGTILFVGSKNYTDKNDYLKYALILTEEMKAAIEKNEEAPEKKKHEKSYLFNLLLSGGVAVPLFEWDSLSKTGFNIKLQAYFEWKNIPCFTAGLSIGYVYNELKDLSGLAHGIPILAGLGYSFRIKQIISIVPQFQAGINYSILQIGDKTWQAFEPIIAPGLIISVNLSKNFFLLVSADWSFIFETGGTIQNLNINAGFGFTM